MDYIPAEPVTPSLQVERWLQHGDMEDCGLPWRTNKTIPPSEVSGVVFPCDLTGKAYITEYLLPAVYGLSFESDAPNQRKPHTFDVSSTGFHVAIGHGIVCGKQLAICLDGEIIRVKHKYVLLTYMTSSLTHAPMARGWLNARLPGVQFCDPVNFDVIYDIIRELS